MAKNLVIYYSRKGQNYVNGSISNLAKGNTEVAAEFIAKAVDAALFEIETVNAYSTDYTTCTKEAAEEKRLQSRPELCKYLECIDQCDNIVVAGPCWWGTFPMPVFSLLERLDFTGKQVFALMTHEGSGLGSCERDLKQCCKGATIGKGLAVHGANVSHSETQISTWAKKTLA